MLGLSVAS
ncbi:hypothetical protein CGLO_00575 [Colletotrichum gloeosporioides Cg-14]|uniref:Uncharacterized protein n=1 Tax=Colletotrichum gloeosporioides (strain Cg-14) TaxID=1237896 RepID=T0MDM9_COLGC|nr:hypothetical protein CGLO_00575 [Colletotrichum gloeosporioides Cg-14]